MPSRSLRLAEQSHPAAGSECPSFASVRLWIRAASSCARRRKDSNPAARSTARDLSGSGSRAPTAESAPRRANRPSRPRAKAAKTPIRVNAKPYQVSAYSRWRLGRTSRVTPPRGNPPALAGSASASRMTWMAAGAVRRWYRRQPPLTVPPGWTASFAAGSTGFDIDEQGGVPR